jgi:hypothetical protein
VTANRAPVTTQGLGKDDKNNNSKITEPSILHQNSEPYKQESLKKKQKYWNLDFNTTSKQFPRNEYMSLSPIQKQPSTTLMKIYKTPIDIWHARKSASYYNANQQTTSYTRSKCTYLDNYARNYKHIMPLLHLRTKEKQ